VRSMSKRTFTLKGAAAGAYVEAQAGIVPDTDDACALRVATLIHLEMSCARTETAVALLKLVAHEGLKAAAKVCTAPLASKQDHVRTKPTRCPRCKGSRTVQTAHDPPYTIGCPECCDVER
jgi:hypothetical protein